MIFKRLSVVLLLTFFATNLSIGEEVKTGEHQINFFTGNFDFSDHKQSAILVGLQHQNERGCGWAAVSHSAISQRGEP